jgi:hypothetical protein
MVAERWIGRTIRHGQASCNGLGDLEPGGGCRTQSFHKRTARLEILPDNDRHHELTVE